MSDSKDEPAHLHINGVIGRDPWDNTGVSHEQFKSAIDEIPQGRKIHVHVNSEGGSVQDGLGIYNAIAGRAKDCTAINDGYAVSIASVIPLAASKVVSPKSSIWMVHNAATYTYGNKDEHLHTADMLKAHDDTLVNIYHEHTGQSKKDIRDAMDKETWLTGPEAVAFGLADSDGSEDGVEDCEIRPIVSFGFKHVPRGLPVAMRISPAKQPGASNNKTQNIMEKTKILALLKEHGINIAADASDEVILKALADLHQKPAPAPAAQSDVAIAAMLAATQNQLLTEKRHRITGEVEQCVIETRIPKDQVSFWVEQVMKDESVLAKLQAMPEAKIGGEPIGVIIESTGATPLEDIKARYPKATARYNKLKEDWNALMTDARVRDRRNRQEVFAANTYSASLTTQFLLDGAVTKLQNKWAALKTFAQDYSTDRYKPLATAQLKYVTAGAAGQTNASNFESGDSTVTNTQISVSHYSQSFHVNDSELNSGLRMENLVTVNISAFADSIIGAAVAPITAANFSTFANIVASPTSFSWNDMQTAWGNIKKSPIHNALLDGEYLARIINVPTQFQRSGVEPGAAWAEFGWDNIALNTNWTGAGANVRGFYCNPQAVGAVAGLPLTPPTIPGATLQENTATIPGIDISIADYMWFSLATRTMWCSYDMMFGAAVLDNTAGGLITSQ